MNGTDDITKALTTNHPAKPYLIFGGLLAGYGLLRSGGTALAYLIAGGVALAKGFEEISRVNRLHDGNAHGVNHPPAG